MNWESTRLSVIWGSCAFVQIPEYRLLFRELLLGILAKPLPVLTAL